MSDYLSRLVERTGSAAVRPALPSLFEPVKVGGVFAAVPASRGTEPISGGKHGLRPASEAGPESQSLHDRVASIQSTWTAAIASATPPKSEAATKDTPPVRVFAAESQALAGPPDKSLPQQPVVESRLAQPIVSRLWPQPVQDAKPDLLPPSNAEAKTAAPPVRVFAAETRSIGEPFTESPRKAPAAPQIARGLAAAAHLLMPAVAASPVASIASRGRARGEAAFAANADMSPAPTIHISIGRVEVRAIMPAVQVKPPPERSAPKLSLDEYLRSRNGGSA